MSSPGEPSGPALQRVTNDELAEPGEDTSNDERLLAERPPHY
jgi:hypothetical protein